MILSNRFAMRGILLSMKETFVLTAREAKALIEVGLSEPALLITLGIAFGLALVTNSELALAGFIGVFFATTLVWYLSALELEDLY